MRLLIQNIKQLIQVQHPAPEFVAGSGMKILPVLNDSFLAIENGIIESYGGMEACPEDADDIIDAEGRVVMPAFCDSHTHLVYAASREQEFIDRLRGLSYEEIAHRGGGILNSALKLRQMPESELYEQSMGRISEIISQGTGAVEIKSGYGLDLESELKMLRVIRRIKETSPLTVKATFLGAHAVPVEFKGNQDGYVDLIIHEMLPRVSSEGLADFVDVFCDRGFFTPDNTSRILDATGKLGLPAKIHANELDFSGGVQVAVRHGALSVDHLESSGPDEIQSLLGSGTMPTLLPGAALFLGLPLPPARQMIDAGLPVALASDFNPGSSPTGNMMLMMALASIRLKMLPEEVIHAATINSAYAMGVGGMLGSISPGKKANLIITRPVPGYSYLPYAFGSDLIEKVILDGTVIVDKSIQI
jgi:imidazolonepropionase